MNGQDPISILDKLIQLFSYVKEETELQNEYRTSKAFDISEYRQYWKGKIREKASREQILSNGWAFGTLEGLSTFESSVKKRDISLIYEAEQESISRTVDSIRDRIEQKVSGVIVYGHGNIKRESKFVKVAKDENLLVKSAKVFLLDASIFYHIYAQSKLNPMRNTIAPKRLKCELVDYVNTESKPVLKYLRNSLGIAQPVIHLFLGNTFANLPEYDIKNLLDKIVRERDVVICEYKHYNDEFFDDDASDHISKMAKKSAAELFSVPEACVSVDNECPEDDVKYTSVDVECPREEINISFTSMLRRKFRRSELTSGLYEHMTSNTVLNGKIRQDTYAHLRDIV